MHKKRPWIAFVTVGVLMSSTCTLSMAIALANASQAAVLGQPLDHAVAVRLDAGETLGAECVAAEVSLGDRRLPASAVRVLIEPTGPDDVRLRVQTNVPVDEPVVAVQVSVGCGNRVSRRYVLLADPPAPSAATVALPAYAASVPDVATLVAVSAPASISAPNPSALGRNPSVAPMALRDSDGQAATARRAQVRAEARAARSAQRDRRAAAAAAAAATTALRGEPARSTAARAPQAMPRLKLDVAATSAAAVNASAVDQALEAVAQAAVAARQSASAASAAASRITALERTVDQLRGESKAIRDGSAQLREQLARAEAAGNWTWPLLSFAAAMAALAIWLGLRLSAARRMQDKAWLVAARQSNAAARAVESFSSDADDRLSTAVDEAKPQRTSPAPFVSTGVSGDPSAASPHRPAPAWPPPAPAESWEPYSSAQSPARAAPAPTEASTPLSSASPIRVVSMPPPAPPPSLPLPLPQPALFRMAESLLPGQVTQALAPGLRSGESGVRDVSIDELLDLEQQAEFFVVLGQDDAAIELLVEHLRNTGGGSPLPYLKLLEIYRRRGDRADYERTRARFNHRFNAYAPEWELDLQAGRGLEDYAGVLPRLQQAWTRPLDSMAELEALLFRKSRGELFDLPAYREVLFLYAMARDLLDRESAETGLVDLLLPLSDGGEFSNTAPTPFMDFGRDSQHGRADFEDRPTAPIDLDLSLESDRPTSIFDSLDESTQPGSRRR